MLRPLPLLAIAAFLWLAGCNRDQTGTGTHTNALIHESSPYLLQHAHNPVDWYPWGDEALTLARANNKLLLISIGYAACHWCHVMEEETFQDTAVARLMNEHFISIKVDREERPDIDDVYMTACQLISRQGCGWPLNAIALPDGRPVWVGTYLPRADWVRLLEFYQEEYQAQPGQLLTYADQIANNLAPELPEIPGQATPFTPALLEGYARGLLAGRDTRFGGQEGAPKFPMPDNYRLLLAYHHYTGDATALEAVTTTLNHLAAGGIFDQLAGGFARYSTDIGWKLPHFEKMLYDNGQLVRLFAEAYAATGTERYREVVDETLAFVANRLTSPEGGFYSSLDADSEGEEGRYYVWTKAEIDSLLPAEQAALVNRLFDILPGGNWEDGKNVLHGVTDLASAANRLDMDLPEAKAAWHAARATLLQARQQRPQPRLDDKILTGWNALMLQGYLAAYEATGTEDYLATARRNADFLLKHLRDADGRLWRNYKDGKASINAFLDDYALLAQALIDLYQTTFDERYLVVARELTEYCRTHFSHEDGVFFYYTSDLDPPLVTRRLELTDNVIASSNSAMAEVLNQLGAYFYDEQYLDRAAAMLQAMLPKLQTSEMPDFYSNWAQLLLRQVYPPYEVAIVGTDWGRQRAAFRGKYLPQVWWLGGPDEGLLPLLKNKVVDGETFIYVCQNRSCRLPVQTAAEAMAQLE